MTDKTYDYVIVGNGILGSLSSLELKAKFPKKNVCLIGKDSRPNSATLAAGAMHAVYAEIEGSFFESKKEQNFFAMGIEARRLWPKYFQKLNANDVITAESTIVYCKKNGSEFELANFDAVTKIADENNCLKKVSDSALNSIFNGTEHHSNFNKIMIEGEFGFNPFHLIKKIDDALSLAGVEIINQNCKKIIDNKKQYTIECDNNVSVNANYLVVAAGYETSNILKEIESNIVPVLKGVGTALIFDKSPASYENLRFVLRTTNRGGAQCGLHVVPYLGGKFYIGAGNYLSEDSNPGHRIETIRYLTNAAEAELLGRDVVYKSQVDLVIGYRPRSLDGFPLIGSLSKHPNIYVISGCNRVALTWAPLIIEEVLNWSSDKTSNSLFDEFQPDRVQRSWGGIKEAQKYYIDSRISNLIEHKILSQDDYKEICKKKEEFGRFVLETNKLLNERLANDINFVNDPDLLGIFAEKYLG